MKARFLYALAFAFSAQAGVAEKKIILPSGQVIEFFETRVEAETDTVRLRFIAPDIASPLTRPSFEEMSLDLEALCTEYGLKTALKDGPVPAQIVISLSAEPIEFGVSNADVEQDFEAFSVENETCILEMF